jgi:hypothetical protein
MPPFSGPYRPVPHEQTTARFSQTLADRVLLKSDFPAIFLAPAPASPTKSRDHTHQVTRCEIVKLMEVQFRNNRPQFSPTGSFVVFAAEPVARRYSNARRRRNHAKKLAR